jgi:uncharacterized protein (TIGR03437 family)
MKKRTGWLWVVLALTTETPSVAQVLNNQSLSGKYFFRHISLGTDGASVANFSDPRSAIGTITFDSNGGYTFVGQQITGTAAAVSAQGSGKYSVDPGGFVSMDSPLRTGTKINARFSTEAVLGSSTDSGDNTFDLFVAIPAPSGGAVLGGPYTTVALEFPNGSTPNMRVTQFSLNSLPLGNLSAFTVNGHAANISQGRPTTQSVTGATFTMGIDGTGSFTVGTADTANLLSGTKSLYLSASGNVILGGSTTPGGHDIVIGVKAVSGASNSTWTSANPYWGAGLRVDTTSVLGYSGAISARGTGKVTWSKRIKALVQGSGVTTADFTGINAYNLNADGTGTMDLTALGIGGGGALVVGASINPADPGAYEIYFGSLSRSLSGTGVFLSPVGVLNAASSAPAGNPISPGQFVALYGTGLAGGTATAKPPYPASVSGVSVLINGKNAPIYFVSAGQINALVPFATTGPTATIVVQNNGANSNTVTVPVAATAPGIYSMDQSGSGSGAILHADFSLVSDANPAAAGETVLIYLTGMGATTPTVADGTAGTAGTLYKAVSDATIYIGGKPGTVAFNGLAPGFPGLYQINVTLPTALPGSGRLPLAIGTGNAYHDQVDISVR